MVSRIEITKRPATTRDEMRTGDQWRNEPKHLGGHNLCEGAKRPSPRERSDRAGGGCGREVPPPTVGRFFIFRLENVQSGAYLRRKYL